MSCRESGCDAVCEVLVSLVDAACGSPRMNVCWIPVVVVVSITGGVSPIPLLLLSIHCPWISLAFTAIGEGKGENRNSVPKRDVVIE